MNVFHRTTLYESNQLTKFVVHQLQLFCLNLLLNSKGCHFELVCKIIEDFIGREDEQNL